jgi:RNA polymerase sigma-70 factor (ECF subfamily)
MMPDFVKENDIQLFNRIRAGEKQAFTILFNKYYKDLVVFSFSFTKRLAISEEIVQEVFLKLWEQRNLLIIQTSLKSFLLKSVQNASLDWLRHQRVKSDYANALLEHAEFSDNDTEHYILMSELEGKLMQALDKLPETYAQAFKMSRFEALNYQEIADKLDVSVRTVEVRISKALIFLREELKDYLILLLTFITLR